MLHGAHCALKTHSYKETTQLTQTLICCSSDSFFIATGGFNCQIKNYFPAVTQRKDDVFKYKSGSLQMLLLYLKEFLIWIFHSSQKCLLPD